MDYEHIVRLEPHRCVECAETATHAHTGWAGVYLRFYCDTHATNAKARLDATRGLANYWSASSITSSGARSEQQWS